MKLVLELIFWLAWAEVLFAYVGYPLLLAAYARLFGQGVCEDVEELGDDELPRVAMVVAAYNEASVIGDKLANTWRINYPADRFQLYVGSDGSADGTAEILKGCDDPRLKAFPFTERRGKMAVLNDLMRQVDADIVVMSDANTMYAPDAVRKLVKYYKDPNVGCVSGELLLEQEGGVSGEGLYWKYEGWIKRTESRFGFLIGCNGGIYSLRKKLYDPLPASTIVDDFVVTLRILEKGYLVRFEPEAKAYEPPCPSSRAEMVRKIRIGAGDFQAMGLARALLHPQFGLRAFGFWGHKVLRWCASLFIAAAFLANLGLLDRPFYLALFLLQLVGALVALCAYHVRPGQQLPRWTRPISYFYLMNYALFCGFWRFVFRTQRVTWDRAAR
jgi:cellulose synthase/poly-beta-1,6-N-acetylglucosamine synthase-like glycosyltransferase